MGDGRSCYSVAEIEKKAEALCYNHCVDVRPRLTVAVDADTPLGTNLAVGTVDQSVARFRFTNNSQEKVQLNDLAVSFHMPFGVGAATSTRNIRLFDESGIQMANAVQLVRSNTSTYAHALFSDLNLQMGVNKIRTFTVKVDVVEKDRFQPVIIAGDYDGNRPSTQLAVSAVGVTSGIQLQERDVTFVARSGNIAHGEFQEYPTHRGPEDLLSIRQRGSVEADQFVVYGTKVSLAWAGDTPSGIAEPSAEQIIGKFIVTNHANVNNQEAIIDALNFNVASNNFNQGRATLKVYKDSLNTPALATTQILLGSNEYPNQYTHFASHMFNDVVINSGASKTFFVTLDTNLARNNATLSLSIPGTEVPTVQNPRGRMSILWGDGIRQLIFANDRTLPLVPKTFSY